MTRLFKVRLLPILAASVLHGQSVVAPTPERPVTARGENVGDYNVTNSFETGYRWAVVGGDLGTYRADVNYGNGIRLLGSNLTVNSKDGHGRLFDDDLCRARFGTRHLRIPSAEKGLEVELLRASLVGWSHRGSHVHHSRNVATSRPDK